MRKIAKKLRRSKNRVSNLPTNKITSAHFLSNWDTCQIILIIKLSHLHRYVLRLNANLDYRIFVVIFFRIDNSTKYQYFYMEKKNSKHSIGLKQFLKSTNALVQDIHTWIKIGNSSLCKIPSTWLYISDTCPVRETNKP